MTDFLACNSYKASITNRGRYNKSTGANRAITKISPTVTLALINNPI